MYLNILKTEEMLQFLGMKNSCMARQSSARSERKVRIKWENVKRNNDENANEKEIRHRSLKKSRWLLIILLAIQWSSCLNQNTIAVNVSFIVYFYKSFIVYSDASSWILSWFLRPVTIWFTTVIRHCVKDTTKKRWNKFPKFRKYFTPLHGFLRTEFHWKFQDPVVTSLEIVRI